MSEYIDTTTVPNQDDVYPLHIIGDLETDPFDDEPFIGLIDLSETGYLVIPPSKFENDGPELLEKSLESDQCMLCNSTENLTVVFIITPEYDPIRDDFSNYFEVTSQDIETVCGEFISSFNQDMHRYITNSGMIVSYTL